MTVLRSLDWLESATFTVLLAAFIGCTSVLVTPLAMGIGAAAARLLHLPTVL